MLKEEHGKAPISTAGMTQVSRFGSRLSGISLVITHGIF
jgi:hypothetical protein